MFRDIFEEFNEAKETIKTLELEKIKLMNKALKLMPKSKPQLEIRKRIELLFKKIEALKLEEAVSGDCSDGSGVIPGGPYKGWNVVRTKHLDDPRPPSEIERDAGFECDDFSDLIQGLSRKRPLGIADGKWQMTWKNQRGYQAFIIQINNQKKELIFLTIMQLNKKRALGYHPKPGDKFLDLGTIKIPD